MQRVFYDKKNDILAIHKGFAKDERFQENRVAGDLVLDITTHGRIAGIELFNASRYGAIAASDFTVDKTHVHIIAKAKKVILPFA